MNQNVFVIILAGGSGKRLWPLSRMQMPKQLLPLYGSKTLLEKTIERMEKLVPAAQHVVVTTQQYQEKVTEALSSFVGRIVVEPAARNTAPALLLSTLQIMEKNPHALIVMVPADHVIEQEEQFVAALHNAIDAAEACKKLVLVGVRAQYPATVYGYLEIESLPDTKLLWYSVKKFHEKPAKEKATEYFQNNAMLWNCGIVCAPAQVIVDEFRTHAPEYLAGIASYETLPSQSFDYAVLEKSSQVMAVKGDFDWSDVGGLEHFIAAYRVMHEKREITLGNAHDNIVFSQKLVVLNGVEDLCIIETDDVLFISKRSDTAQVGSIVDALQKMGLKEYV